MRATRSLAVLRISSNSNAKLKQSIRLSPRFTYNIGNGQRRALNSDLPKKSRPPGNDGNLSARKKLAYEERQRDRDVYDSDTKHLSKKPTVVKLGQFQTEFDVIYLRDACSCPRCVDSSTSQKLFETADIPLDIEFKSSKYLPDGSTEILWQNDIPGYENHRSIFMPSFSKNKNNNWMRKQISSNFPLRAPWSRQLLTRNNRTFPYEEYMNSTETLHEALNHLQRYGIIFIESMPSDPSSIELVATRIGPLRNSLYGSTWDVRSVPSAKNVAYTSQNLGFHMDLLYMQEPPGLQLLHTLKASSEGGESLFSDGFEAFRRIIQDTPQHAIHLKTFKVTYRYKNDGHWYQQERPTIQNDTRFTRTRPKIRGLQAPEGEINWSPPFQGPLQVAIEPNNPGPSYKDHPPPRTALRSYVEAAKQFKTFLEAEDAVFQTKMAEGTCVIFDNRRILHARKAFGSNEERWLRGAYVDKDPFHSRLRVLNEEFGNPYPEGMRLAMVDLTTEKTESTSDP
ncbi:hypothetical protein MMC19_003019 [Ptychographa xylographoides]|nr:hypothetical protein [Ptychographa xylographoides]